ncbi:merozoite surface protein 7 (MSP7), putative [Plasmodium ovale wallikeri]|uniref:Merozoite surface protein 7 (MSP7), putative n=2 Tax=Plasmodium ovale TaxID=36330 RepID=A0A1A8ZAA2_PLAOA|nr:merozoite surface protein 7 (MSP7), putative [Plasmodium ovale wallikeri]SBT41069.1 merozoite surface protein 7 (MSP7), putative [Plasmodium ovale wallikeri]SBT78081.1 MSP7-like protein, putative [Plasmodium ovale]
MVKQIKLFSSLLTFLLLKFVSSEKLSNYNEESGYFHEDVENMLKRKLGNVYNAGPNSANEAVDKKYKMIKKEMEELQKHEKENAEDDFKQNFMTETDEMDETSGKKKTIFGVDEDDLDSYDEEFVGQSKKFIKGEASGDDASLGTASPPEESSRGTNGRSLPVGQSLPVGSGGDASAQGTQHVASPESPRNPSDPVPAITAHEGTHQQGQTPHQGTEHPGGTTPPSSSPETSARQCTTSGQLPNEQRSHEGSTNAEETHPSPGAPLADGQLQPTPVSPEKAEKPGVSSGNTQVPIVKAPIDGNDSKLLHVSETEPKVQYLENLYDDILKGSNKGSAVDTLKRHSNYNDIKKEHELPMNGKEYTMVKKLFGDCFKKGNDDNSNATCVINVFTKVLNDKAFREEFENVVNGIYGFAKRNSYLRGERITNEEMYKAIFNNALNMLNTF